MKRLLFLGLGSALVFAMGGVGPAQADGGQHISSAQVAGATGVVIANAGATKCASCHRAHTAKAEYLLKQAQPQLCYSCHEAGAGASTDVVNGETAGNGAALRGGGFAVAKIGSGLATKDMYTIAASYGIPSINQVVPALAIGAPTTSKHNAGGTAADAGTAWGNGALNSGLGKSLTLECGSCHDPHGNGNYRILRPVPVDSGALAPGVKIPDAIAKVYTTANYWLSGDLNVPAGGTAFTGTAVTTTPGVGDGYIQNVAAWCTTCHTRYLAPTGSYKTASGDATFMYRHRSDANYKAGAANCITCHVSHGSNAVMAGASAQVPLPGGAEGSGTADSKLLRVNNRGTCVMCHNV